MKKMSPSRQVIANKFGVSLLLIVVLIGSASLLTAVSVANLSFNEMDNSFTSNRGAEVLSVAESCSEEIFKRVKKNINYGIGGGEITIPLSFGSCIINISDLGSGNRVLILVGIYGEYSQKLIVNFNINGKNIVITSWREY